MCSLRDQNSLKIKEPSCARSENTDCPGNPEASYASLANIYLTPFTKINFRFTQTLCVCVWGGSICIQKPCKTKCHLICFTLCGVWDLTGLTEVPALCTARELCILAKLTQTLSTAQKTTPASHFKANGKPHIEDWVLFPNVIIFATHQEIAINYCWRLFQCIRLFFCWFHYKVSTSYTLIL